MPHRYGYESTVDKWLTIPRIGKIYCEWISTPCAYTRINKYMGVDCCRRFLLWCVIWDGMLMISQINKTHYWHRINLHIFFFVFFFFDFVLFCFILGYLFIHLFIFLSSPVAKQIETNREWLRKWEFSRRNQMIATSDYNRQEGKEQSYRFCVCFARRQALRMCIIDDRESKQNNVDKKFSKK